MGLKIGKKRDRSDLDRLCGCIVESLQLQRVTELEQGPEENPSREKIHRVCLRTV